jgi:hypothetical protein
VQWVAVRFSVINVEEDFARVISVSEVSNERIAERKRWINARARSPTMCRPFKRWSVPGSNR